MSIQSASQNKSSERENSTPLVGLAEGYWFDPITFVYKPRAMMKPNPYPPNNKIRKAILSRLLEALGVKIQIKQNKKPVMIQLGR